MTEQRDWQKDMELLKEVEDWEFDPTFNGEGNIVKDTTMISENIGVSYASTIFNVFEALPYWLQQYAAAQEEIARINCDYYADKQRFVVQRRELEEAKERADKLEQERDDAISGLTESYKELSWNYDRMKLRERELKETMKWAIEQSKWGDSENAMVKVIAMLQKTLDSLYPKEETKP